MINHLRFHHFRSWVNRKVLWTDSWVTGSQPGPGVESSRERGEGEGEARWEQTPGPGSVSVWSRGLQHGVCSMQRV